MRVIPLISIFLSAAISLSAQQRHLTGQRLDIRAVNSLHDKPQDLVPVIVPPAIDLKPYAPSIANQSYNNCYAYASVYAGRTILYNITVGETTDPSKNIFAPGFIQKLIYGNRLRRCRHYGADTHYACQLMEEYGALPLRDFPLDCSTQVITEEMKDKAATFKIKAYKLFQFCASNEAKISAVKNSLAQMKPVVIGINSIPSFHMNGGDPDLWEPSVEDRRLINCNAANHAVCIVGYDDNKYGGAFEIMNSWSKDWKGDGRIWIKYNDLAGFMMFAIELSNN